MPRGFEDKVAFVWRVADKLRGHFKPHEYGSVMLPLLVLRRLDACSRQRRQRWSRRPPTLDEQARAGQDRCCCKRTGACTVLQHLAAGLADVLADDKNIAAQLAHLRRGFSPGGARGARRLPPGPAAITRLDRAGHPVRGARPTSPT